MSSYFGTTEQVEAARAKRRAEVKAWAQQDQAEADALVGVPVSFDSDWDIVFEDNEEDEELEAPVEILAAAEPVPAGLEDVVEVSAEETTTEEVAPKAPKTTKAKPEATSKG
jgi:hypothetical protein